MFKIKLSVVTVGVLVAGVTVFGQIVKANDKESTANLEVTPGELTIKKSDNINFDAFRIDGKDKIDYPENGASKILVEDLRGSITEGWQLRVNMKDSNFLDSGLGLKISPTSDASYWTPGEQIISINEQQSIVGSVINTDMNRDENDIEIALNAKMDIPKRIKAASYKTTLIWNLQSVPGIGR